VGSLGLRSPQNWASYRRRGRLGTCLSREAVLDVLLAARLVLALSLLCLQVAFVSRVLAAELLILSQLVVSKVDATPALPNMTPDDWNQL
jgi:hypothetical protein